MNTASIIRLPEVTQQTGLSKATIYRLINEGKFPKQFKLGQRSSGWLASEINQWVEQRIEKRKG